MPHFESIMEKLQEEQELLAALLEQIDEEVLIADGDGTILMVNSKLPAAWGGTADEYIGRDCRELNYAKAYGDEGKRFLDSALRSDEKIVELYTEAGSDGKFRHYLIRVYPYHNAAGTTRRVIMTRLNLTKEAELQQRVQISQKMAVIGEMMAYVAHEIRNPLMCIGGFARTLAADAELPDQTKEKARVIADEAKRLEDILLSVSAYAKPSDVKEGCVDVNLVAEQVRNILTLSPEYRQPQIRLELSSSGHIACGDKDKLIQCLVNLIKNAREAMDKKEGLIIIRTRHAEATVYLEVEDNGPGIPEKQRSTLFAPYVTTKPDGTGLGLSITHKLITEMGGRIFLHSKENVGSLFSIALQPAFAVSEEALAGVSAAQP